MSARNFLLPVLCAACAATAAPPPPTPPPAEPPARAPSADPAAPSAQPPAPADPAKPVEPPRPAPTALPTLDEALGLASPGSAPPRAKDTAKPAVDADLARVLDGQERGNELARAVGLMERAATRLSADADTSVQTQRMQEETIRLLDALIRKGNQKQQQKGQGQQSQSQDQQQGQQPQQSPASQQQQGAARATGDPAEGERSGSTSVQAKPALESARAAWGNLPARVRQALLQGSGDSFSKEYQKLTEEYYRRLGESGGGR